MALFSKQFEKKLGIDCSFFLHKMANIDVIRVLFDLKECILHSCEYSFKNSFIWLALPIQCIATALLFIESNKPTPIYTKSLHKNFIFIPKVCLRISCWKHTRGYLLGFPLGTYVIVLLSWLQYSHFRICSERSV